ncbi:hypothetical protein P4H71_22775 [Paenibacillus kribbensis]|uniref:hypothetical protein n=1 Tax=Paenibacillus TaxID=44249 RepID=UPI00024F0412|nr:MULTISPECIES: hypothetical protein [Paenibacillus]EHS56860.1 hypothetical protein WG8_3130 [Paenibacillus sp. Aloe-11]MEC0237151.1 hypothetical protein [Paenibacillus kribbensis]
MAIDTTKSLAHDEGFPRVPNIVYRMYPLLDGFTLETVGLYGYLKSWRQNKSGHRMYGKAWLNQKEISAQTGMSPYRIRKHVDILQEHGLLKVTKSSRTANKLIYEPLEPLTEAEFRLLHKAEIERFARELDRLESELEADRARLTEKQEEFERKQIAGTDVF